MRPSEALARHRDEVLSIISKYPVSNPRIFGSVARGEDTETSDLDILVEHGGRASTFDLAGLELELEALLRARVDVRTLEDFSHEVARRAVADLRSI